MAMILYRKLRPWFISLLCLGLTLILFKLPAQEVASAPTLPASTELRGVWLTNVGSGVLFAPWGVNRALRQLSKLKFNTVYPVVWNRGHTFYPSAVAKKITGNTQDPTLGRLRLGRDVLSEIVQDGHQHGLRIIPWFEYGLMAPANSQLARRNSSWITTRWHTLTMLQDTLKAQDLPDSAKVKVPFFVQNLRQFVRRNLVKNQVWFNPLHPGVQQFMLDLIAEVVTNYDVAGIQLDDHFGMPVELGYDPYTIRLYQQEHQGQSPPENSLDPEWMRWRANKLTQFMQRIHQTVNAIKPNAIVSLSPNSQAFAYRYYLQDWPTWVQQGLVDELIVQVYRDDLSRFAVELSQPALQMARRQIPVSIGLLSGLWSRPVTIKQIREQVRVVRDRGFDGVSFFYWESLWGYLAPESPRKRRQAFRELFSALTMQSYAFTLSF